MSEASPEAEEEERRRDGDRHAGRKAEGLASLQLEWSEALSWRAFLCRVSGLTSYFMLLDLQARGQLFCGSLTSCKAITQKQETPNFQCMQMMHEM